MNWRLVFWHAVEGAISDAQTLVRCWLNFLWWRRNFLPVVFLLCRRTDIAEKETPMHGLIYLVGLIVVILAILSLFGLR